MTAAIAIALWLAFMTGVIVGLWLPPVTICQRCGKMEEHP